MEAIGVDAREVLAVLERPDVKRRQPDGGTRMNGYGLTLVVDGVTVRTVGLDGADRHNWEDWARERAQFGDGANVPILVPQELEPESDSTSWATSSSAGYHHFKPRLRRAKPPAARVHTRHVLDDVHPALRASITEQVGGDFSRLIVHSSTKVEILPPSD